MKAAPTSPVIPVISIFNLLSSLSLFVMLNLLFYQIQGMDDILINIASFAVKIKYLYGKCGEKTRFSGIAGKKDAE